MDWEVSQLGLSVMRLPHNKEQSVDLIRYAVGKGMNFIYADFIDEIDQEEILRTLRRALRDGFREKVKIAITIPSKFVETDEDFDRLLDTQLNWLEMGKVDFCLLEGLNRYSWPRLKDTGVLTRLEKAIADGTVDKAGFQFHDYFQALREVIDEYDNWSLCSFRYSYMDVDHHPGYGGLKYAADKGLGVIVTDPHLGGHLTARLPDAVAEVWKIDDHNRSLSEWALRWVWHHREVSTAVSAMSTIGQVEENAGLADIVETGNLTIQEQILISRVRDTYRKLKPVPCTACRACMPCIQGIDVPRIFEIYNDAMMYGDMDTARAEYLNEGHRIESCIACGSCVNVCGKQIPILEWLDAAKKRLSE